MKEKKNKIVDISKLLKIDSIFHDLECQNKIEYMKIISKIMEKKSSISSKTIFNSLYSREKIGSTGIGNGIAIPHGKIKEFQFSPILLFTKLKEPISFGSIDNEPVDLLLSILISKNEKKEYLSMLFLIAKELANENSCRKLRKAKSKYKIYSILKKMYQ
ncbi:PTS sugar transporter subunit IIA [bacterium endosymbiont of Pedicinus badii]|uniref:PTS sugar transporter subunit IIA n=1 Tax=bacterium endosymbiont of Pedicinus badii TaxID=1719126 RepID=UPI0009B9E1D8|nr:PTS sugar transporter subunit IIA [bacterium endosymbiont of Pedicinus badii]OQM34141.1 hypothetical protein AOQ89_02255 [bacterium endosymbiont of Pedicinus badii]